MRGESECVEHTGVIVPPSLTAQWLGTGLARETAAAKPASCGGEMAARRGLRGEVRLCAVEDRESWGLSRESE